MAHATALAASLPQLAGPARAPAADADRVQPLQPAETANPDKVKPGKTLWFDPHLPHAGFMTRHNSPALAGTSSQKMGMRSTALC